MVLDKNKMLPGMAGGGWDRRRRRNPIPYLLACLAVGLALYIGLSGVYREQGGFEGIYQRLVQWWSEEGGAADPGQATNPEAQRPAPKPVLLPTSTPVEPSPTRPAQNRTPPASPRATDATPEEEPPPTEEEATPSDTAAESPEAATPDPAAAMRQRWARIVALEKAKRFDELEAELKGIAEEHRANHHGASATYRLGLLAWQRGAKEEAEALWKDCYARYLHFRGGRYAALALADLWYGRYCRPGHEEFANWEPVRNAYSAALGQDKGAFWDEKQRTRMLKRLRALNQVLIFSRAPCSDAEYYVVKPGDRLEKIGKRYGVHYDSIATINGIRKAYIRVKEKLKIIPFKSTTTKLIVDKDSFTLTLYHKEQFVKRYAICHGGPRTPVGTFTIVKKSINPPWTDPETQRVYKYGHPKNTLGTRWLKLDGTPPLDGIGIHGTTEPDTIPGSVSNGCVRMYNRDVEELYGFALLGSTVVIRK